MAGSPSSLLLRLSVRLSCARFSHDPSAGAKSFPGKRREIERKKTQQKNPLFLVQTHKKQQREGGDGAAHTGTRTKPFEAVQGKGCFCGNGAGIGGGWRGPPSRRRAG